MYLLSLCVFLLSHELTFAQSADVPVPVSTTGFNANENAPVQDKQESWIMRDHHYLIVIVAVLVVVALILFYIVRGVRSMRMRLAYENEQQMNMLNRVQPQQPYPPIDERAPPMMDGYKYDQYSQQQQQQHLQQEQQPNPHQHRY